MKTFDTFIDEIHRGHLIVKYRLEEAPTRGRQLGVIPFTFDYMEFFVTQNIHDEKEWVCIDEFLCDSMYEKYEEKIIAELVGDIHDYEVDAGDYAYTSSREDW